MGKNLFRILLFLMSISLLGIILIQSYFIYKNYNDNNLQFSSNVSYVLSQTSSMVEKREFRQYVNIFNDMIELGTLDTTSINNLYIIDKDLDKSQTIIYQNGVVEENIILPKNEIFFEDFFNKISKKENILIKRLSNQRQETVFSLNEIDNKTISPQDYLSDVRKISKSKEILFETAYNDLSKRNSIEDRIGDIEEFEKLIKGNFNKMNIHISFEYAIYDKDSITNISSEGFVKSPDDFSSVVFKDENNISDYSIRLNFPNRTTFLLSSIVEVVLTSFVLITIIILAYITTILLLIRQRQISQIKSDFINNMSHEFKTPIATINLALSAIKNPQIIGNKRKVNKYLKMIDDENNRMYEQVENVLMISQLEKNELNIEKRSLDLKNVINSSVSHLNLIIKNKNGKISIENEAKKTIINGNESHLTNVFINILDNALKYNDNIPEILIKLYNFEDKLNIEIVDNGIGMSKNVKSKIFQKFFREQTGNLHDIKGHGLGLSYVKKIIDFHDGSISVESELGVGSKFKIELNV